MIFYIRVTGNQIGDLKSHNKLYFISLGTQIIDTYFQINMKIFHKISSENFVLIIKHLRNENVMLELHCNHQFNLNTPDFIFCTLSYLLQYIFSLWQNKWNTRYYRERENIGILDLSFCIRCFWLHIFKFGFCENHPRIPASFMLNITTSVIIT